MLTEIPADQIVAALDECAAAVLWEAGVTAPPVDAMIVARELGLIVAQDDALASRGRLIELADPRGGSQGQATVVLGPAERPERLQWALAHEVGESVAYRVFETLGVRPADVPEHGREAVANHLASCLLLPREWFRVDGPALEWDLISLKGRYTTASHELIARRLLEMAPPIVVTLCDLGKIRWRRTNAGGRPPELLPEEARVWRESHETGQVVSANLDPGTTGLEKVTAWPIHEPDWKREILRSAIADC